MTIKMLAPNPYQQFQTRSGTSYTADVNGLLNAVAPGNDVLDLLNDGCVEIVLTNAVGLFGSSVSGLVGLAGNLSKQVSLAGVGNAADTTDDTLFTYSLPANSLDVAGRGILIQAAGTFAANGNNKRVQIKFGGTTYSSGTQTGNAIGWEMSLWVMKVGAANSNTQLAQGQPVFGSTHGGVGTVLKPTETENAAIAITLTGASQTTGAANDVLCNMFTVTAFN